MKFNTEFMWANKWLLCKGCFTAFLPTFLHFFKKAAFPSATCGLRASAAKCSRAPGARGNPAENVSMVLPTLLC